MKGATPHAGIITYAPIGIIRSPHTMPERTPAQSVYAHGCLGKAEIMSEYGEGLVDFYCFKNTMDGWHRDVDEPTAQRRGRRGYRPDNDPEDAQ